MARHAVLVDLDGTVWDSWPFYCRLIESHSDVGHEETRHALAAGQPIARLLRSAGIGERDFAFGCRHGQPLQLYDGVHGALQRLQWDGVALGAVTNLPGWIALPMLRVARLDRLFGAVATYGTTIRRKPHPEPVLHALARLDVRPSKASWYAGDTRSDARAASAAGLSFAWARYGYGDRQDASAVLEQPCDLLGL